MTKKDRRITTGVSVYCAALCMVFAIWALPARSAELPEPVPPEITAQGPVEPAHVVHVEPLVYHAPGPAPEAAPDPTPAPEPEPAPQPAPVSASAPQPNPDDLVVVNIMEALVEEKSPRYISMFGLCSCERCAADVRALTLTNLQPAYVVVPRREVHAMLTIYESRFNSTIFAQLTRSCKVVMDSPRHNQKK